MMFQQRGLPLGMRQHADFRSQQRGEHGEPQVRRRVGEHVVEACSALSRMFMISAAECLFASLSGLSSGDAPNGRLSACTIDRQQRATAISSAASANDSSIPVAWVALIASMRRLSASHRPAHREQVSSAGHQKSPLSWVP